MLTPKKYRIVGYECKTTKNGKYVTTLYVERSSASEIYAGKLYTEIKAFTDELPEWLDNITTGQHTLIYSYNEKYGYVLQAILD